MYKRILKIENFPKDGPKNWKLLHFAKDLDYICLFMLKCIYIFFLNMSLYNLKYLIDMANKFRKEAKIAVSLFASRLVIT